jgi:hypothetical protein
MTPDQVVKHHPSGWGSQAQYRRSNEWCLMNAVTLLFIVITSAWCADVTATRLKENPLITVKSSASLGDNVNGPSVIRVPEWVKGARGRYYMYFADHKGHAIRLAYANTLTGPWKIYEPGVLGVQDTAFRRPLPDPPEVPTFYTHVASPEVWIDTANKKIVMWFHGMWTDGNPWPADDAAAVKWTREHGYAQFTQAAESIDGIHFHQLPPITKRSYLRVFQHDGYFYGMARLGVLLRSKDPLASFELGANPFRGGPYADRVRHVALLKRDNTLYVFFSAIGDAPEKILLSTIDLRGDWSDWKASAAVDVLIPSEKYECADLPVVPSKQGDAEGPVHELRDPAIFEEHGKVYLLYSICGEQGIAAAELKVP